MSVAVMQGDYAGRAGRVVSAEAYREEDGGPELVQVELDADQSGRAAELVAIDTASLTVL